MQHSSIMQAALAGLGIVVAAGTATAQTVVHVNANISTSTTWTASNRYDLDAQIYVLPGATLTIEAGTVIATTPQVNGGGSLAVCRGAQIFVQGTDAHPVIMTSTNDTATWTANNPKTGTWREVCSEWGNLTIMGNAYISYNNHGAAWPVGVTPNVATPAATNVAPMEGLTAAFPGDPNVIYGGGNDDDDSGSLSYLSIRYGGRVIGLGNELNGLSMGGIGRGTDVHHIEIMNNVDDGVETWGGTVNYKYISVWNIGDDSFDIDEGWRGKAQFLLLVQGSSADAAQGSGVGDNCFEHDGAEDSDWQPVTTGRICNATAIGQPVSGDQGTAWRDGCRMQYHNCIFMDIGEQCVKNDNTDGDGGSGYGFNGTLGFASLWSTASSNTSTVNAPANPAAFYMAQSTGMLAEIKDTVFYNNNFASAYTTANTVGVFNAGNNNVQATQSPIQNLVRGPQVIRGGSLIMVPVTSLDPRPANDALTSVNYEAEDGFFSSAHYRGAFAPGISWLGDWTASTAYGLTPFNGFTDLGQGLAGVSGDPVLSGTGTLLPLSTANLSVTNAAPNAAVFYGLALSRLDVPFFGGTLVPSIIDNFTVTVFLADGAGNCAIPQFVPGFAPVGFKAYMQCWVLDPTAVQGLAATNGISVTIQ